MFRDVSKTHPIVWTFCGVFTLHHLRHVVSFRNVEHGNDPYGSIRHVIAVTIPRFVGVWLVDNHISGLRGFWLLQHTLTMCILPLLAFPGFPDRRCIGLAAGTVWRGKFDSLKFMSARLII